MSEQKPDWLVAGAKVVVFNDALPSYSRNVRVSTIAKVATKSFTVDGERVRFSIAKQQHHSGNAFLSQTRCVVPFDSDTARAELATARHRQLVFTARDAVQKWERKRTRENRLAAIAALQAIETDEEN